MNANTIIEKGLRKLDNFKASDSFLNLSSLPNIKGITTMKGWENYIVVSPVAKEFPYTSASYDFYSTMHHALSETFSDNMEFGEGFFDNLNANYAGPKNSHLYRIVKVVRAVNEVKEVVEIKEVQEEEDTVE